MSDPFSIRLERLYNVVAPHGGCAYTVTLAASLWGLPGTVRAAAHDDDAQCPMLAAPAPACGREPGEGLFLVLPLPDGAGVRVPVCDQHATEIEALLDPTDSTERGTDP